MHLLHPSASGTRGKNPAKPAWTLEGWGWKLWGKTIGVRLGFQDPKEGTPTQPRTSIVMSRGFKDGVCGKISTARIFIMFCHIQNVGVQPNSLKLGL